MEQEIWRSVCDYKGIYEVSNSGKVRNMRGTILKARSRNGYLTVQLSNDGETKHNRVHQLVARAFIQEDLGDLVVNHKNAIKNDNRVENLELVTPQGNIQHAVNMGLKRPFTRTVDQYTLNGVYVATFYSIRAAAAATGANEKTIPNVCAGRVKQTGGFIWKYTNESEVDRLAPGEVVDGIPIKGYPNFLVTRDGRIYSEQYKRWKRPRVDADGYRSIKLARDSPEFMINRLVAQAYIPNPENKPIVDHIDGDKSNNKVENLRWSTYAENTYHSIEHRQQKQLISEPIVEEDDSDIGDDGELSVPNVIRNDDMASERKSEGTSSTTAVTKKIITKLRIVTEGTSGKLGNPDPSL